MDKKEKDGVVYYAFENIENTGRVRQGFSTRLGGVSEGHLESMNLAFTRGDLRENVLENYRRFCSAVDVPFEHMVMSRQVHDDKLERVGTESWGRTVSKPYPAAEDYSADGIMTDVPETVLVTFFADCVPLLFYDPQHHALAATHAGWRGTALDIGRKTVARMVKEFGTRPADVLAGIGPSIGPQSFEVSTEVVEQFRQSLPYAPPFITSSASVPEKYYVDLWGINKEGLLRAGLAEANIEIAGIDTVQNHEFYSHRRDGDLRGSMAMLAALV